MSIPRVGKPAPCTAEHRSRRRVRVALAACACAGLAAGCTGGLGSFRSSSDSSQDATVQSGSDFELRTPAQTLVLPATDPAHAAVLMSQTLFEQAEVVVVADLDQQGAAADVSTKLGAPLLLASPGSPEQSSPTAASSRPTESSAAGTSDAESLDAQTSDAAESASAATEPIPVEPTPADPTAANPTEPTLAEIARLDPDTLVVAGAAAVAVAEETGRDMIEVDPEAPQGTADLPDTEPSALDGNLTVLTTSPSTTAARATAQAVGATHVSVPSGDPRRREAMEVLQSTDESIIGVGRQFGDTELLAGRMDVVRAGVELPGGGQVLFPGRMMVALYGHPGAPVLGVLGEQDLEATIARAKEHASWYSAGVDVPVVPTLEIIATVASAEPGAEGDYSSEYPASQFQPYVEAAKEEGVYVLLDLQPGRDRLLEQAKQYESLLAEPHVGLAIDPEWKLHGNETPLRQIGHIDAEEINEVTAWLADLTKSQSLPQKLVVLHQFRLSMLPDREQIDTNHDALAILIHADGQGTQGMKQATWAALRQDPPDNVTWGWKNFYDEDSPTLTPQATLQIRPRPNLVSYQ